jgi:hypothetical protein
MPALPSLRRLPLGPYAPDGRLVKHPPAAARLLLLLLAPGEGRLLASRGQVADPGLLHPLHGRNGARVLPAAAAVLLLRHHRLLQGRGARRRRQHTGLLLLLQLRKQKDPWGPWGELCMYLPQR